MSMSFVVDHIINHKQKYSSEKIIFQWDGKQITSLIKTCFEKKKRYVQCRIHACIIRHFITQDDNLNKTLNISLKSSKCLNQYN